MTAKRVIQSIVVVVILVVSLASTGRVLAWSGCASYITVQPSDTLSSIAVDCGTTVDAIQAANPGMIWSLAPGQVLYIPTGYNPSAPTYFPANMGGSTYVIQWGDTLGDIAMRNGVSLSDILAFNPQIWNPSLIFPGQVINLPAFASVPSSTNYPSAYDPTACNPSPYNPSACDPTTFNPSTYDPTACNPSPYNPSACDPLAYNTSTYNSSTNDPNACNPSPYNPSACDPLTYNTSAYYPSTNYPSTYNSSNNFISIVESPHFSALKVTYGHGLLVRSGPAMTYSEIKSPFVSAVKDSKWAYRNKSVTVDSTGLVWVEVALSPLVDGYSTGWIMVKDQLGTYFTRPNIDP